MPGGGRPQGGGRLPGGGRPQALAGLCQAPCGTDRVSVPHQLAYWEKKEKKNQQSAPLPVDIASLSVACLYNHLAVAAHKGLLSLYSELFV